LIQIVFLSGKISHGEREGCETPRSAGSARAVTPGDIASVNDAPTGEAMTRVILAVAEAERLCKVAPPGNP
jgi:hypothetical protein